MPTPQQMAEFDQITAQVRDVVDALVRQLSDAVAQGVPRAVALGGLANQLAEGVSHEHVASIAVIAIDRLEQLGRPS